MRDRVLDLLARHMSRLHAEMTLRRAVLKVGIDPHLDDARTYPKLALALEHAVRLFTVDSDADATIRELRSLLTPQQPRGLTVELRTEADMSLARQAARTLAEKMGARSFAAQKFTTAVSELARNIVQYAGSGTVELSPLFGDRRGVRVCASDQGPGIANLDEILGGRYESRTGLGKGLLGVRRLMDTFSISTGVQGTRVEAELLL